MTTSATISSVAKIVRRPMRFIGICPVCAENHSVQQIDRLCGLIPIVTEESAMSQISKPINSDQVSFSGQVLEDSELAAISGGDTVYCRLHRSRYRS